MKTMTKKANGGGMGKAPSGDTSSKAKKFADKMTHKSAKSSHKGTSSKAKTYA